MEAPSYHDEEEGSTSTRNGSAGSEFAVYMTTPEGKTTELPSGTTVLGRGNQKLGITDRRVSRKHAEVTVSKETNTVTLMSSGVNPSYIHRKGENKPEVVKKGELKMIKNGDRVSLVENGLFFQFAITEEEEADPSPTGGDEFDQDATQPNMDAFSDMVVDGNSPGSVNSPVRAGVKRGRGGPGDSPARPVKKPKSINWGEDASLSSQDWDSQNSENSIEMPGLRGVKIDAKELRWIRPIGQGSCGEVYEALWHGTKVAVKKVFRGVLQNDALKEFKAEAHILRRLRHPNVILFMGTCIQKREMCIVTEFMCRGSLNNLLKDETCELSWDLIVKIALGAAQGMNYLHTFDPPIIHRDLKSHNLLVDLNYNVKVTDFGLARPMNADDTANTFCGTMPWTAPEIFNGSGYTTKADVYSYGIVLWELITRLEPYEGLSKPQIIVGVSKENLRPVIPPGCPPDFAKLMADCWDQDPERRPRFAQILERLEAMQPPPAAGAIPTINVTLSPRAMTERFKAATEVPVTLVHSWEIESSELVFLEEVGQGASANVFKGKYRGQQVAIKVLKDTVNPEEFKKEFEIMSEIRSPLVVFFYGAVTRPNLAIVTEFLSRGSLYDVMCAPDVVFTWELALKLATEAAKSVNALHCWKPSIYHRDLKSPNLLVDENFNVKVADFGLARFNTTKNEASLAKLRGTYVYASPEVYNGQPFTTKSDVFSYGVILWELVVRVLKGSYQRPYAEYKNLKFDFQILIQSAKKGVRPTIPAECPPRWRELITKCWNTAPEARPDFEAILEELAEIKANPELSAEATPLPISTVETEEEKKAD